MFSALAKTSAQVCQAARMKTTQSAPATTWGTTADVLMSILPLMRCPYHHQLPRRPRLAARLTAARSACRASERGRREQHYFGHMIIVPPPKGLPGPLYWGKLEGYTGTEGPSALKDLPSPVGWITPLVMKLPIHAGPLCVAGHVTARGRTNGPVGLSIHLVPVLMFRSVATLAVTITPISSPLPLDSMIRMGAHPSIRPRRRLLDAGGNGRELGISRVTTLPAQRRNPPRGMRSRISAPSHATSRAGSCHG